MSAVLLVKLLGSDEVLSPPSERSVALAVGFGEF